MNQTNTTNIAGSLTRHTMTAGGVAGLVGAQDDILRLVSLLVTIIGLFWSIWEKVSRKGGGTAATMFLGFLLLSGATGCATRDLDPIGPYQKNAMLWTTDGVIVEVRDAYGVLLNLADRNPDVVANSAQLQQVVTRIRAELDGEYQPDEILPNLVKARDAYASRPAADTATALEDKLSIARVLLDQARDLIPALLPPQ